MQKLMALPSQAEKWHPKHPKPQRAVGTALSCNKTSVLLKSRPENSNQPTVLPLGLREGVHLMTVSSADPVLAALLRS